VVKRAASAVLVLASFLLGATLGANAVESVSDGWPSQQEKMPPLVTISPDKLDFGEQVIKRASKPQRLTVTNTGQKSLYINSATVAGDNKEDFTMTNDTCTGATVDPGKSCIIDVSFTPAITENRKGNITITDTALDSPQRVVLTGNGINPVRVPPR
jgi:HYDIN/CFA65/VesB family protein